MTTLPYASSTTIRPVRADEIDIYWALTQLVDLHVPSHRLPALKDIIARALYAEPGPFSHGLHHFLIAETADGTPVGAVHVGPAFWMFKRQIPARVQRALLDRVSNVDTIAVHPDYRHQGTASHMLARVEAHFGRAGYRALTLRHEHGKKRFFASHGYTSLRCLSVDLPPIGLITDHSPGWEYAVKPLDNTVTFTSQRGRTTLSGLLD